jgi:chromosome segregation ATPase
MIKVNALAFLFIIQFMLTFLGLTVFLYLQNKKLSVKEIISRGEINRLRSEIQDKEKINTELLAWKDMFDNLQKKFEQIKGVNAKLKEAIALLIPEAQRSKEYEQLIADIEQNNKELDMCINTLQKENEELDKKAKSFQREISELSTELQHSVSMEEFKKVSAEKKRLEIQVERLKEELDSMTKQYENLEKNYIWLEKEYNALYKNISDDKG